MGYPAATLNTAASDEIARYLYISLHTTDPGTTGTAEATGGSPAYARKAAVWGTPSGGVVSATQGTFDVPAGTYGYFGLWSAVTAGTFFLSKPLNASQSPSGQTTIPVTVTL